MPKPIVYDLYCGLGGWSEAFIAEGYEAIGFDIEAHDYGTGGYPGELRLRDILTLHGSELKDATCIVGSSPCQKYSYMAMPWKRAKAMVAYYADKDHPERLIELNALFNAQFRIQREAIEAAGHYIQLVVENVRGAQKWVGRAQWNYGSFYLWGDVPALMPMPMARKLSGFRFDGSGKSFQTACVEQTGYKTAGMNWSDPTLRGQDFTRIAGKQALAMMGVKEDSTSPTGLAWDDAFSAPDADPLAIESLYYDGQKAPPIPKHPREDFGWNHSRELQDGRKEGGDWWNKECRKTGMARFGSKSNTRKAASAMIAKIPFPLAQHIARCFQQEGA